MEINEKWLEANGMKEVANSMQYAYSKTINTPAENWDGGSENEYLLVTIEHFCHVKIYKASVRDKKVDYLVLLDAQVYNQEMAKTLINMYLDIEGVDCLYV